MPLNRPIATQWPWRVPQKRDEPCRWYAIADAAQHKALPGALVHGSNLKQRCLFDTPQDSPIAAHAPHLVELPPPFTGNATPHHSAWKWIERHAPEVPCITVLKSALNFDELHRHLRHCTEVLLPDGEDMFLAFWDPMILGTLLGQSDDPTLYVAGPALDVEQRARLTADIQSWWYWDRNGGLRSIHVEKLAAQPLFTPLRLTYQQMDMLVEASVPDQVLHFVELNQAHLLNDMDARQRYNTVRDHLVQAKVLGLTGMSDMVNYVCAALIYGSAMKEDPQITNLLEQVRSHRLTLNQALEAMP